MNPVFCENKNNPLTNKLISPVTRRGGGNTDDTDSMDFHGSLFVSSKKGTNPLNPYHPCSFLIVSTRYALIQIYRV